MLKLLGYTSFSNNKQKADDAQAKDVSNEFRYTYLSDGTKKDRKKEKRKKKCLGERARQE